jgi:hypothetical protein
MKEARVGPSIRVCAREAKLIDSFADQNARWTAINSAIDTAREAVKYAALSPKEIRCQAVDAARRAIDNVPMPLGQNMEVVELLYELDALLV